MSEFWFRVEILTWNTGIFPNKSPWMMVYVPCAFRRTKMPKWSGEQMIPNCAWRTEIFFTLWIGTVKFHFTQNLFSNTDDKHLHNSPIWVTYGMSFVSSLRVWLMFYLICRFCGANFLFIWLCYDKTQLCWEWNLFIHFFSIISISFH